MNKVLGIIAAITVIALIIFLLFHFRSCGLGEGDGDGDGNGTVVSDSSSSEEISESESETDTIITTVEEVVYVAITVKEKGYLYQNSGIELDELLDKLEEIEGKFCVRITDENASKKAYDALTTALENKHIVYEETE